MPPKPGLDPQELRLLLSQGRHELFLPLAHWAQREGRLEEARALLMEGLERFPDRVAALVLLARTNAQMGRLEEARQLYQRVLEEMDPRNLPALRAMAVASLSGGDEKRARGYLERWRREDPEDPELADLIAEMESENPGGEEAEETLADDAAQPGILELGLSELEQGLLAAPSLADEDAWRLEASPVNAETAEKED